MKWVATTRPRNHQIIDTANDNRIVSQADQTLDRAHTASESGFFLIVELRKLLWSEIFGENVARYELAVSNCRQQIINAAITIFHGDTLHLAIAVHQHFFWR